MDIWTKHFQLRIHEQSSDAMQVVPLPITFSLLFQTWLCWIYSIKYKKTYLHILITEIAQVFEFLLCASQEPICSTYSILWCLLIWWGKDRGIILVIPF